MSVTRLMKQWIIDYKNLTMWLERKVFAEFLKFAYTNVSASDAQWNQDTLCLVLDRLLKHWRTIFCTIWSELKFCIMSMIVWCGQEISKSYCSSQHNFRGVWAEAESRYVVSAWSGYTVLMTSRAKLIVGGHNYTTLKDDEFKSL